jgi:hypothetical protein
MIFFLELSFIYFQCLIKEKPLYIKIKTEFQIIDLTSSLEKSGEIFTGGNPFPYFIYFMNNTFFRK